MFKLTPFSASPRRKDDFDPFTDFFDDFFSPMRSLRNDTFKVDVEAKDDKYLITADLPGVKKNELKVSYDEQTLHIAVEREESKEEDEKKYLHKERRYTSMRRSLYLPDVEPSSIKASLKDGILHIDAAKSESQTEGYLIDVE